MVAELRTLSGHTVLSTHGGNDFAQEARTVSASQDGTLKVWELESGRELRTLTGHSDQVRGGGSDAGETTGGLSVG